MASACRPQGLRQSRGPVSASIRYTALVSPLMDDMREDTAPEAKRFTLPLQFALAAVLVGVFLNLQHWPGGDIALIAGLCAIVLLYPLRWAAKSPKRFLDHVKLTLALSWPISTAFNLFHLPNAWLPWLLSSMSFLIWLGMEGVGSFWTDDARAGSPSRLSIVIYALSFALVIGGTLFRIQHWPYGNFMIVTGLGFVALWFAVEFLFRKRKRGSAESDDQS